MIFIASDHAGFDLKSAIVAYLISKSYIVNDLGTHSSEQAVDYPDFANKLCKELKEDDKGILICGSGIGMSIAANRYPHVRAALCRNVGDAELSRKHNDSNILVLGARVTNRDAAFNILDAWLKTEFEGGRHQKRLEKLYKPTK